MRAITFDVSVSRFLLARSLGQATEAALFGPLSGLRFGQAERPALPGADWVGLRVIACGICGSDLGNLTYRSSPTMEPFGSFPAVLGHEVLAVVDERESDALASGATGLEVGQRVVVDPMISCLTRGYPVSEFCRSCREGLHSTCENAGEEGPREIDGAPISPGSVIGYHRSLPGGWGERMIAHRSQVFPVSDALSDDAAVLIEPLSIGVHAVLRSPPAPEDTVLVIGSGPIAFGTIWALRATGFAGRLIAQTKRPHEAELAMALGASEVVKPGPEAREALIGTGANAYMPIIGPEVYAGGGFPIVFDCVGNASSLGQALRFTSTRGRIVLLGCAGEIPKLDLTMVWARELEVKGFVGYGRETWRGETKHTFEVTHDLLVETQGICARMVTHTFPLERYREALSAAANHRKSKAIRVVLKP